MKWREALLGGLAIALLACLFTGNFLGTAIAGLLLLLCTASLARTYDREGRYGPSHEQRRR